MSNSNVPVGHDSSLDDAALLRRCERRIATFPPYKHDFSFASADSTLSSILPASSVSEFDESGDGRIGDSFLPSTETPTDTRTSTGLGNISVNRNPFQDIRRCAEHYNPTHFKSLDLDPKSAIGISLKNSYAANKLPEFCQQKQHCCQVGSHEYCASASQKFVGKRKDRIDTVPNAPSESVPIIDNLILEDDSRTTHETKLKQRKRVARFVHDDIQRIGSQALMDSQAYHFDKTKPREQRGLNSCGQLSCSKSLLGGKDIIDQGDNSYLKRLDTILEQLSMKSNKQPSKSAEKVARAVNTKEALSTSLNKSRKISPCRKSCNCPRRSATNNKLSLNSVSEDVKPAGLVRHKMGSAKLDRLKQDNNFGGSKNIIKNRCPKKTESKKQLDVCDSSISAGKEHVRKRILPQNVHEKSSCPHSNNKRRSKSLSSSPRCHVHSLTMASFVHPHTLTTASFVHPRGQAQNNTDGYTVHSRKYPPAREASGKLTRQQKEILKHIPGDITPDEIAALLKTVLSIADRRQSMKSYINSEGTGGDLHKDKEESPESSSKYQLLSLSDISNTSIFLSPKCNIHYSNKAANTWNSDAIPNINSSSEATESKDESSQDCTTTEDLCCDIRNVSKNYGTMKQTCDETLSELASTKRTDDFDKKGRVTFVPLCSKSVKCSESKSSTRTYTAGIETRDNSEKKQQLFKKSAVVLPYDNFSLPSRTEKTGGESAVSQSSGAHLANPICKNVVAYKDVSCTGPETKQKRTSSAPSAISSTASRHIGWRNPLDTERKSQATIPEEKNEILPKSGQAKVKISNSVSSDGLLYCKSTNALMRAAQHEVPKRSCASFGMLPVGNSREATEWVCRRQQHAGKLSSRESRINIPELPVPRGPCSLLPPCPHERVQSSNTFTCQDSSYTDHNVTALSDGELDKTINDLRSKLRDTYQTPVKMKFTTMNKTSTGLNLKISNATFILSEMTEAHERQEHVIQNESQIKDQFLSEIPDLDALSCSTDTVMTNTSLSNRLQELEDELLYSPKCKWITNTSKHPAQNLQNVAVITNPNEFQGNQCSSCGSALLCGPGGMMFGQDITLQFCHQPIRTHIQEIDIQANTDKQQLPKDGKLSETYVDSSKSLFMPPSSRLSCLMSPTKTFQSSIPRTQNVAEGLEQHVMNHLDRSCSLNKERTQQECIPSINVGIFPVNFRQKDSETDLKPPPNVKALSNIETSCNSKLPLKSEPTINTRLVSNLKRPSTIKPPSNFESPCKLESTPTCQVIKKNLAGLDCVTSPKQTSQAIKPTRITNLTQLKESTESLLAEVYRKYYCDLLAPNMESARTPDLTNTLEILQNFSPISQVDVNTRYPLVKDTTKQLTSPAGTSGNLQNGTNKSHKNSTQAKTFCNNSSNQTRKISPITDTTSKDKNRQVEITVTNSNVRNASTAVKVPTNSTDKQIRLSDTGTGKPNYFKPTSDDQTVSKSQGSVQTRAQKERNGGIIDVTSPEISARCPDEHRQYMFQNGIKVNPQAMIVKTYNSMSAVPVSVKEVSYEINNCSALNDVNTKNRLFPKKASPQFETRSNHWAPVVFCSSSKRMHQSDNSAYSCDDSDCCTIACHNTVRFSATAAARKQLASSVINARVIGVHDSSLTSTTCEEEANDDFGSEQKQQGMDASSWDCTDNNNNSSKRTPERFHKVMSAFLPSYENDSATTCRPSAKILGELAFQLERRILDYVFGMDGSKRRRFYGYTVNNICQMMNKESKNVSGSDDPVRKSELAYRLKKLLIGLRKVGYDIKIHGDFAQQMVNAYGLLPCPPDPFTIKEFNLHNATFISSLITELSSNEDEAENLQILLKSLKYLSKCDGRPLFVW